MFLISIEDVNAIHLVKHYKLKCIRHTPEKDKDV